MYMLVFYVLTADLLKQIDKWQRYGHLIACGHILKKDTYTKCKPIDQILQPSQQLNVLPVRAFMTANLKLYAAWSCDCSCSESLLCILQNAYIVYTILHGVLIPMTSHIYTKLQI